MAKRYKKNNRSIKLIVIVFILIIFIAILVISSIKIVQWFINNNENGEIQEKISNYIEENTNDNTDKKEEYKIDFASLKEINPDMCAWLKVNNTNIEYTVVKTNNNTFYLNHNFEKKKNLGGWPFSDYRNKLDSTDYNIIVYGHNMKDGSMFGNLKDTLKEEWYQNEENRYVTFVTSNGTYKYEVFSIYEEKASDYYIQTDFDSNSEYIEFVKNLKDKSVYDFNIDVLDTNGILTLSTCGKDNRYRVVLHAKLI